MQPGTRPSDQSDAPAEVVDRVRSAESVAVLTGAGMSRESGIATFREAQTGLWEQYAPEAIASVDGWNRDHELVWGWYQWRAHVARQSDPNSGHLALAELSAGRSVSIITQNVDDLHERAGSRVLSHLHGSLFEPRCEHCGTPYHGADAFLPDEADVSPQLRATPPTCMQCLSRVRPGIVWFGEALPMDAWSRAEAAVAMADVVLVVGTSGIVYPAARLPETALAAGIPVIEINPEVTPLSGSASYHWRGTAATTLPVLLAALNADAARS